MSKNILAELEAYGLSDVIQKQETPKHEVTEQGVAQEKAVPKFNIDDYVYTKNFICPVCGHNVSSNIARESKIRIQSVDLDLRPICSPIEPILYNIVLCESCYYSAPNKVFSEITSKQVEIIRSGIRPDFRVHPYPKEPTVEMAIERYKLALRSSVVKHGKDGEKAYLCMKLTWLYRIKGDDTDNEKMFAEHTVKGFTAALGNEIAPIMGLEESSILYMLGAFSMFLGRHESALRILSDLIVFKNTSERLKDRARDLKNEILAVKLHSAKADTASEQH